MDNRWSQKISRALKYEAEAKPCYRLISNGGCYACQIIAIHISHVRPEVQKTKY